MDGTTHAARTDMAMRLAAFGAWWRDELAALLPPALVTRLSRRPAIDCALLPDGRALLGPFGTLRDPSQAGTAAAPDSGLFAERLEGLVAEAGRSATVRLSIPRAACLVRTTSLPRAALPHAGPILRHEIEALLPDPPQDILADWYVESEARDGDRLVVRQAVLLRPRIAELERAIDAAGARLARITVGDLEGRPLPVDLLCGNRRGLLRTFRELPRAAQALLALAALLFVGAAAVAADRPAATLYAMAELRAAYGRPSPTALSAGAVAEFLADGRPTASRLLDEIAARLPQDAHLTRFALDGDTLTLGLAGPGAGASAAALRASPLVGSAEPVAETPDEVTLRLRIAPAGGDAP